MANFYGKNRAEDFAASKLMSFGKSFSRMNGQPLDESEVWYNKAELEDFAAGNSAYVGMKLVYVDETNQKVYQYSVQYDGSIKEIGVAPLGDGKSIAVDAETGTVSLKGIDTLVFEREVDILGEDGQPTGEKKTETIQYQPLMTKDGLVWVEPSKTTVEGLATLIEALSKRVDTLEQWKDNFEDKDTTYSVKDGEKVLSLDGTEFGTTLKLNYANNKIQLLGINDVVVSEFDASAFVADGVLQDADYDATKKELVFTWNIETGKDENGDPIYKIDRVNIGDLVDTYTAGNGINILENVVSAKIKTGEKYLKADTDGLYTAGIDEAIAAAIAPLPTEDTNTTYTIDTGTTEKKVAVTLTPSEGNAQTKEIDTYNTSTIDDMLYNGKYTKVTKNADGSITSEEVVSNITTDKEKARLISTNEIAKLSALVLGEDGSVGVSGTISADNVTGLDGKINSYVTGSNGLGIEAGAQVNKIETIKVNGNAQIIDANKAVDISVPTAVSDLENDQGYLTNVRMKAKTVDGEGTTTYEPLLSISMGNDSTVRVIDDSAVQAAIKNVELVADTAIQTAKIAGTSLTKTGTELSITKEELATALGLGDLAYEDSVDTGVHAVSLVSGTNQGTVKLTVDGTTTDNIAVTGLDSAAYKTVEYFMGTEENPADNTILGNASAIAALKGDKNTANTVLGTANALATLVGADTNKSVRTIAGEVVAEIVDNAPEAYDTLKEIADWIANDETGAAAMSSAISKNTEAIKTINETTIPSAIAAALAGYKVKDVDNTTLQLSDAGVASIKEVSTDLLVQGTFELVLNGGSAN